MRCLALIIIAVLVVQSAMGVTNKVELYAGCSVPQWGISNYNIGPDGFQQNTFSAGNVSLSDTTQGGYTAVGSMRPGTWVWVDSSGRVTTYTQERLWEYQFFDGGCIFYWNLSKIPAGTKIKRAYVGLSGTDIRMEFGNHPTGREGLPFKRIINPMRYPKIWTVAHLIPGETSTKEGNWNGASWLNWKQAFTGRYDATASRFMKQQSGATCLR